APRSRRASAPIQKWRPGWDFEVIPNGVLIPPEAHPGNRDDTIVFIGRHDPRKGMPVLLKAWPDVHRRHGARRPRAPRPPPPAGRRRPARRSAPARPPPDPARWDRRAGLPPAAGVDPRAA